MSKWRWGHQNPVTEDDGWPVDNRACRQLSNLSVFADRSPADLYRWRRCSSRCAPVTVRCSVRGGRRTRS